MKTDLTPLHGMLVKLALKRTARDSDWHTALARIKVDGDRATCRCVVCGCHRLSLAPEIVRFLLAVVTAYPETKSITLSDGHYDNEDSPPEIEHVATGDDLRPGGSGEDDVGITLP
jgi:hypothetical protein